MIATPLLQPGLLSIDSLCIAYHAKQRRTQALRDISLRVGPGGALGIIGESGSGKTSLALAVLGLLGPAAEMHGSIEFEGQTLSTLPPRQHRTLLGRRIGAVFQDPFSALNPSRRVGVQIAEPMRHHLHYGRLAAYDRTLDLLAEMGLEHPQDIARSYPHQLSGGMQQRASIAAALACQPSLLILDEPTTALDVTIEAQILALLANLRRRHCMAMLVISHSMRVISALCEDVCVIYAGRMVESGSAARVLADPAHPYTHGLLASRPSLSAMPRARLPSIAGYGLKRAQHEPGCVFAPRCTLREAACDDEPLPFAAGDPNHIVLCWKHPMRAIITQPLAQRPPRGEQPLRAPLVTACGITKSYVKKRGAFALANLFRNPQKPRQAVAAPAVDGVSFTITAGEILGLVGESGCGKSTLGRLILRLATLYAGAVSFAGTDLCALTGNEMRRFRRQAQLIFQNTSSALNGMTV